MEKSYRKSLYEQVKSYALGEKCFNKYKKNFTQCSNQQLVDLIQCAQGEDSECKKLKNLNKVQEKNETCNNAQIEDIKKILVTSDVLECMADALKPLLEKFVHDQVLSTSNIIYNKLEEKFRDLVEKEILTNLSFSNETKHTKTSSEYMYGKGVITYPIYTLRWKKGSAGFKGSGEDLGVFRYQKNSRAIVNMKSIKQRAFPSFNEEGREKKKKKRESSYRQRSILSNVLTTSVINLGND